MWLQILQQEYWLAGDQTPVFLLTEIWDSNLEWSMYPSVNRQKIYLYVSEVRVIIKLYFPEVKALLS